MRQGGRIAPGSPGAYLLLLLACLLPSEHFSAHASSPTDGLITIMPSSPSGSGLDFADVGGDFSAPSPSEGSLSRIVPKFKPPRLRGHDHSNGLSSHDRESFHLFGGANNSTSGPSPAPTAMVQAGTTTTPRGPRHRAASDKLTKIFDESVGSVVSEADDNPVSAAMETFKQGLKPPSSAKDEELQKFSNQKWSQMLKCSGQMEVGVQDAMTKYYATEEEADQFALSQKEIEKADEEFEHFRTDVFHKFEKMMNRMKDNANNLEKAQRRTDLMRMYMAEKWLHDPITSQELPEENKKLLALYEAVGQRQCSTQSDLAPPNFSAIPGAWGDGLGGFAKKHSALIPKMLLDECRDGPNIDEDVALRVRRALG